MKKTLFIPAALAAFAFIGCNKNQVEPVKGPVETPKYTLSVSVPVTELKSMDVSYDDIVEDVQILLFDQSGLLESYGHSETGGELRLQCTAGEKSVVALVNAPDMSAISTRTELLGKSSDLLADNQVGRYVMEGEMPFSIDGKEPSYKITVPVKRIVSKIYLGTVRLDYSVDHYEDKVFKIDAVYLINVAGNKNYLSSSEPSIWYNKLMAEESGKNPLIYDKLSTSLLVVEGSSYAEIHNFFCYPNPSADSSELMWSPRSTRFVVEATLDGQKYYYPVTMPAIEQNKKYKVNLIIRRPGSSSPDVPVQTYWGDSSVDVLDWDETITVDKEL